MRKTLWASLPWILLSACGGNAGAGGDGGGRKDGGGDGGGVALQNLGERLTTTYCGAWVACGQFPDEETCRALTPTDLGELEAGVNAGRIRYDGVAAAACVDMATGGGGLCIVSEPQGLGTKACDDTFTGTVAAGGGCFNNDECASRDCDRTGCNDGITCCEGKCRAFMLVATGGDCSQGERCAAGNYCESAPNTPIATCKALVTTAGQPCNVHEACAPGLWCRFGAVGATPICTPLPGRGQDCDVAGLPCNSRGDVCDGATHKCVERRAVGATCTQIPDCVAYATCDEASHTCVALSGIGGACTKEEDCLGFGPCVNGACTKRASRPVCPR